MIGTALTHCKQNADAAQLLGWAVKNTLTPEIKTGMISTAADEDDKRIIPPLKLALEL